MSLFQAHESATLRKLSEFANLPVGWHFGAGGPISAARLDEAKRLLSYINMIGFTRTDAFPSADGEVLLSAYHERNYLSVIVQNDSHVSITHERDAVECCSAESVTILEAKKVLLKIAGEIWPTFGWSTQGTSTLYAGSLMSLPSASLLTAGYLSSNVPVPKPQVA